MSVEETPAQATKAAVDAAFRLEQRIITNTQRASKATWALAKDLYDLHETGAWALLGYETLNEFLARPELGISRSSFFRMTKSWRDLVVVRQIPRQTVEALDPSKVQEVIPAIMRGQVAPETALADAAEMGKGDLRIKYRKGDPDQGIAPSGIPPSKRDDDGDGDLDRTMRVKCPTCNQFYTPDPDDVEGDVIEGEVVEGD